MLSNASDPTTRARLLAVSSSDWCVAQCPFTAVTTAGAVADRAEVLECEKYSHLDSTYEFVPVAVESCGLLGSGISDEGIFEGSGSSSKGCNF